MSKSHVRVFSARTNEELDRQINQEMEGNHYKVTAISITFIPSERVQHQRLVAAVAFGTED